MEDHAVKHLNGLVNPRIIVVAVLCVVVPAMAPVTAGIGKGNGEIGVDLGWIELDSDFVEDRALGLAVRGGYFFTDLLEVEGQLGSFYTTDIFSEDLTFRTFFVDAVFNFRPTENIVPYALVGVGMVNQDIDPTSGPWPGDDTDDSSSAYLLGGGSRFFLGKNKKIAIRAELTFLGEDTFDQSSTHARILVGVTWRLGQ
jgi:opacity protein-like surface antigen